MLTKNTVHAALLLFLIFNPAWAEVAPPIKLDYTCVIREVNHESSHGTRQTMSGSLEIEREGNLDQLVRQMVFERPVADGLDERMEFELINPRTNEPYCGSEQRIPPGKDGFSITVNYNYPNSIITEVCKFSK